MPFSVRHALRLCILPFLFSQLVSPAWAACGIKTLLVQGRVENAPPGSSVVVELAYERNQVGESDRLLLDHPSFRTRIQYSTQRRSFSVMGRMVGHCDRKPTSVIVVLLDGEQELDRVTLSVAHDFKAADPSELAVRSEVVLHGP